MAKRMKSGYTVNEIQDIIQTAIDTANDDKGYGVEGCLLYTSPSPRDLLKSRMPSSA